MLKKIALCFFVLLLQTNYAQEEKSTHALQPFSEIKVFDGLSVNLIKSEENKAVITGSNIQKVAIVNNDGVLKIRMEINKLFSGYRTQVDLYYNDLLTVIDVNEDSRITSSDVFEQEILELKSQEGGEIVLNANVEQLLIKSVTGGSITTSGKVNLQDVVITTGGTYKGKELLSKFTTVSVSAGSFAEIYAENYVKATVRAGGEVFVYGDPTKMDEKSVFGGKIKRM